MKTMASLPGLTPLGAAALAGDEGLARLFWESDADPGPDNEGAVLWVF